MKVFVVTESVCSGHGIRGVFASMGVARASVAEFLKRQPPAIPDKDGHPRSRGPAWEQVQECLWASHRTGQRITIHECDVVDKPLSFADTPPKWTEPQNA